MSDEMTGKRNEKERQKECDRDEGNDDDDDNDEKYQKKKMKEYYSLSLVSLSRPWKGSVCCKNVNFIKQTKRGERKKWILFSVIH